MFYVGHETVPMNIDSQCFKITMLKYNAKKYIKINNFKWFAVKLTKNIVKLYVYFPPNGIEKERDHCVVNKFESHNISFS